jgi:multiple antibiotic resistance protein
MNLHLQAIVTVLSLMNPIICGVIFGRIQSNSPHRHARADATKAAFAILVILELAALGGPGLLNLFGISLEIFSVAGGGVLIWMGFSMLAKASSDSVAPTVPLEGEGSITRLILFAASPGTITGVITLAVSHSRSSLPVTAMVAVAVATLVTWLVMLLVARKGGKSGGMVQSITQCFMGLIVMAMGAQLSLTGLTTFVKASFLS